RSVEPRHVIGDAVVPLHEQGLSGSVLRVATDRVRHGRRHRRLSVRPGTVEDEETLLARVAREGVAEDSLKIPNQLDVPSHDSVEYGLPRLAPSLPGVLTRCGA